MDVVLLERVEKLGQMGDVVTVRNGHARNFLLPAGKALRANKANIARFEAERAQLEARNLERKAEADRVAADLSGKRFVVIRSASETGALYGSVSARDVAETVTEGGFSVARNQIRLEKPVKELGLHPMRIALHPEVAVEIEINVARTEEEARIQASGGEVLGPRDDDEDAEGDDRDLAEFFDNADSLSIAPSDYDGEVEDAAPIEDAAPVEDAAPTEDAAPAEKPAEDGGQAKETGGA